MPPDADAHDDDWHGNGVPAAGQRYAAQRQAAAGQLGPGSPFHPHDDRIVSLALHHTIDTGIAHDVIIDAWWRHL